jgi:methylphosphotriester-DNA--protein-cysteine methyltransferase
MAVKTYKLLDKDGNTYLSEVKGALGGHRRTKIYGRLDCPTAERHIKKGQYVQHRVFFADQAAAEAAGYRPCGVCLRDLHKLRKESRPAG